MMIKQVLLTFLGLVLLNGVVVFAQIPCGPPVVVDNITHVCSMGKKGECNKLMFVITGFQGASDIGAHISSTPKLQTHSTDCFIQTRKMFSWLKCREFSRRNGESYELSLGRKTDIDSVMVAISRRTIIITVNKHSTEISSKNKAFGPKKEKIPYIIQAIFPILEENGFCLGNPTQYKANGAMYKIKKDGSFRGGKSGTGYRISAYMAPF